MAWWSACVLELGMTAPRASTKSRDSAGGRDLMQWILEGLHKSKDSLVEHDLALLYLAVSEDANSHPACQSLTRVRVWASTLWHVFAVVAFLVTAEHALSS